MTPARTHLAATLARIEGERWHQRGDDLGKFVAAATPDWERRLGEVLEAARAVLGPELLRGLPIEPGYGGLDGPGVEPFVHDSAVELA